MQNNAATFLNESESPIRYTILFLTKWYPNKFDPQLGVFVQKHAKAISEFCNVSVLYACADDTIDTPYKTIISNQNGFNEIIVYYKKNTSVLKSIINLYRYFNANKIGIREIQKTTGVIDLIHVNVMTRPGLIALIIKKLKGIPFIITEHWTGYVSGNYEKTNFLKKWLNKLIIRNANVVSTVSESLRRKMIELGLQSNYVVVPNVIESIDSTAILSNQTKEQSNAKTKILTVADLVDSHKNISAVNKLKEKYPNIKMKVSHVKHDIPTPPKQSDMKKDEKPNDMSLKSLLPKNLNKTIKNPDTGRTIKVKTALGYDKNTQVYKAAANLAKKK